MLELFPQHLSIIPDKQVPIIQKGSDNTLLKLAMRSRHFYFSKNLPSQIHDPPAYVLVYYKCTCLILFDYSEYLKYLYPQYLELS